MAGGADADPPAFVQTQKLVPADLGSHIRFPYSIEIDGRFAVAGAKWDDAGGLVDSGSAYVYELDRDTWVQRAKLVSPSPVAGEEFGLSVEISGDVILVGAPYCTNDLRQSERSVPSGQRNCPDYVGDPQQRPRQAQSDRPGSVYAFRHDGHGRWVHEATLRAPVPAAQGNGDTFGWSLGFDGRTAVVSAPWGDAAGTDSGAAYVFERARPTRTTGRDAEWSLITGLLPRGLTHDDNLGYGYGTHIDGRTVAIGAFHADTASGPNTGAAWVFRRTGRHWVEEQKLVPSDASALADFGHSVTLDRNRILVGSPGRRDPGSPAPFLPTGSAYVFRHGPDGWVQEAQLSPPSPNPDLVSVFGVSSTLERDVALVVAPAKSLTVGGTTIPGTGAVFVYQRTRDGWVYRTRLVPDDPAPGDTLHEADIFRGTVMLGAAGKTGPNGEAEQGALYVFADPDRRPGN
jgi:hypothetical protein